MYPTPDPQPWSPTADGPEPIPPTPNLVVYMLSEDMDYSRSISPAAGPVYAARMGWTTASLGDVEERESGWVAVDNRLSEPECEALIDLVARKPDVRFLVKVIDPYEEWCRGHHYYRALFRLKDLPNVSFLSPYVPKEVVKDLEQASGRGRLVVVPYPYPVEHEVDVPLDDRQRDVIFSGNQHPHVYPYRHRFRRAVTWWPPLRRRVATLEHPGYPDIGHEQQHDKIGDRYVAHLSQHTHMFLSPSRCHLEFLKYGECAAAGCLPMGALPDGLHPDIAAPFVQLDFDGLHRLVRSARRALEMPRDEVEARATAYREAYRRHRSSRVLNAKVAEFVGAGSSQAAA